MGKIYKEFTKEDIQTVNKHMKNAQGNSLAVQWLGLGAFTAGDPGLIPGWGTKILQAMRLGQKKKKKMLSIISHWENPN